jgi:hypothetical protein
LRPSNPSFNQGIGGGRGLNNGQPAPGQTQGGNAGANTGGGGGAAGNFQSVGGNGGSGVVILKLNY